MNVIWVLAALNHPPHSPQYCCLLKDCVQCPEMLCFALLIQLHFLEDQIWGFESHIWSLEWLLDGRISSVLTYISSSNTLICWMSLCMSRCCCLWALNWGLGHIFKDLRLRFEDLRLRCEHLSLRFEHLSLKFEHLSLKFEHLSL